MTQDPATQGGPTFPKWEPRSLEEIEREFAGWHAWRGISKLYYARLLMSSPAVVVEGEDFIDLRDQIIKWIWNNSPSSVPDERIT